VLVALQCQPATAHRDAIGTGRALQVPARRIVDQRVGKKRAAFRYAIGCLTWRIVMREELCQRRGRYACAMQPCES
jgi:hypothetical protein